MKQTFTLLFFCFGILGLQAQSSEYLKSFKHFEESRGDADNNYILTLPYEETVVLNNNLNSTSGLGPTFNYYGTVVIVDQMDVLPNGDRLLVLRREDGRDFYGYTPTIKAILSEEVSNTTTNKN